VSGETTRVWWVHRVQALERERDEALAEIKRQAGVLLSDVQVQTEDSDTIKRLRRERDAARTLVGEVQGRMSSLRIIKTEEQCEKARAAAMADVVAYINDILPAVPEAGRRSILRSVRDMVPTLAPSPALAAVLEQARAEGAGEGKEIGRYIEREIEHGKCCVTCAHRYTSVNRPECIECGAVKEPIGWASMAEHLHHDPTPARLPSPIEQGESEVGDD